MGKFGLRSKMRIFMALGGAGILCVVAAVAALFLVEIEDTVYADGRIVPEDAFDIVGHLDARVAKLLRDEGDDVRQGEVIALLDSREFEDASIAADSVIKELEAELEVKRAELATLEREPLPKELWHSDTNLKECEDKAEKSLDRLERSRKLSSLSAISKLELEKAEIEYIQSKAELDRARENSKKVAEGLAAKILEKARRDIELVRARIEGKRAALELCRKSVADCKLVAPAPGRLVELPCKTTMYVQKGKPAAKLAAGTSLKAIAQVDERVVRKIRPGQAVRISSGVYSRLQYGSFPGTVERVLDVPSSSQGPTKYPVEIRVGSSNGCDLKIGSSAEIAIATGIQPAIYAFLNISKEPPPEPQRRPPAAAPAASGKIAPSSKD